MTSWIPFDKDSPFSLENIPFGVVSTADDPAPRCATIVGDTVVDLKAFAKGNGFKAAGIDGTMFEQEDLNAFAAAGRETHNAARQFLKAVFTTGGENANVLETSELRELCLIPKAKVTNHVPLAIGDYTDFYVGKNHAYNCGVFFRGPDNALQPNYYHLPVGYHGRASSVVVSGTDFHRPCGQILPDPQVKEPAFSPCKRLDLELELAAFISKPNELGTRVDVDDAENHIFGYVLMNDWSARDIQAWEYVPLGPFTAKNFATAISPWVVLHDALDQFRSPGIDRPDDKPLLGYLQESRKENVYDLQLQVELTPAEGEAAVVSRGSSRNMLFSFPQMIAHHTVTGCNMRTGDLIASGTISGTDSSSYGSLLEMTGGGKQEIAVGSTKRKFLQDGDRITLRAAAGESGKRVGFGSVTGKVLAAKC